MNTLKDHYKQQMKKNGHECTINYQVKSKCFFREIKDMKGYQDMKYMFTTVNHKQGDIIECIHKRYVVIQLDQSYNNVYDRYIIRELTHVVKVKENLNIPVFFKDVIIKMNETSVMYDTTQLIMYAPYTNTQLVNSRFIFKGQAWIIKSQNRLFLQGLVVYNLEADVIREGEDKQGFEELEPTKPNIDIPPTTPTNPPTNKYNLEISMPTEIKIEDGNITIQWEIYSNGIIANNSVAVKWTSDNTSIIDVDNSQKYSKKLILVPKSEGQANITVNYMDYTKTYSITVTKVQQNKPVEIIGDEELKLQTYQKYSISEKIDNIEWKINKTFSYTIKLQNIDSTTIKLFTDDKRSMYKTFKLECWSGTTKVAEKEIEIVNII